MDDPRLEKAKEQFYLSVPSNLAGPISVAKMIPDNTVTIAKIMLIGIEEWLALGKKQDLIGEWEVVWGPGIFQSGCNQDPNCADCAMYVAYNQQEQEYSICVAGTPSCSTDFDWDCINLAVDTTVHWGFDTPGDVKIARGALTGLNILQQMKDPLGAPGEQKTLEDFLKDDIAKKEGEVKIVTNGISLGGALSPILALWLQEIQECWDPLGKASICSWPFAGYSTATQPFKDYADERLEVNRVANALDVVPHWWNQEDLDEISTLYSPEIEPDDEINRKVDDWKLLPGDNEYHHLGQNPLILEGTVNEDIIDPEACPVNNFNDQSGYQHELAYAELLGLPTELPALVSLVPLDTAKTRRSQATGSSDKCLCDV